MVGFFGTKLIYFFLQILTLIGLKSMQNMNIYVNILIYCNNLNNFLNSSELVGFVIIKTLFLYEGVIILPMDFFLYLSFQHQYKMARIFQDVIIIGIYEIQRIFCQCGLELASLTSKWMVMYFHHQQIQ